MRNAIEVEYIPANDHDARFDQMEVVFEEESEND